MHTKEIVVRMTRTEMFLNSIKFSNHDVANNAMMIFYGYWEPESKVHEQKCLLGLMSVRVCLPLENFAEKNCDDFEASMTIEDMYYNKCIDLSEFIPKCKIRESKGNPLWENDADCKEWQRIEDAIQRRFKREKINRIPEVCEDDCEVLFQSKPDVLEIEGNASYSFGPFQNYPANLPFWTR